MKRKFTSTLIMLLVMFFTLNVNAADWQLADSTIEKGIDSGELYNLMPTQVNKNEEISVKFVINNAANWQVLNDYSEVEWDSDAFEIVESNGKYYNIIDENVGIVSVSLVSKNKMHVYYQYNGIVEGNKTATIEIKFKVKNLVKDGVYRIYQTNKGGLNLSINNANETLNDTEKVLQFLVGKPTLSTNYSKDSVKIGEYIIGEYLFKREENDEYPGYLTADYIMLASKSIKSDKRSDMIIYTNTNTRGWVNAITGEAVAVPNDFNIRYINMKANYQENGIYSDNDDKLRLRLIQITDKEAIVTLENSKEKIHGIATINNRVATLTVSGIDYIFTITDDGISLKTSDSYIGNASLTKRVFYSADDYFALNYVGKGIDMYDGWKEYLKSSHTGKYVNGNKELFIVRYSGDMAKLKICTSSNNCLEVDAVNNEQGLFDPTKDATYLADANGIDYGIKWNENQVQVVCYDSCDNNEFVGTYEKKSSISMSDILKEWEKKSIEYRVTFNKQNGEEPNYLYVYSNTSLESYDEALLYYDDHTKNGAIFKEWKIGNESINLDYIVKKPVTLIAEYDELPVTPVLSIDSNEYNNENGIFEYNLLVSSTKKFDGVALYDKYGLSSEPVATGTSGLTSSVSIFVNANTEKIYYARAYKVINGITYYSENSNEIVVSPVAYTVSFKVDGNVIETKTVKSGDSVSAIATPFKNGYTFKEWQLNGLVYNFGTPVESDITLIAVWKLNVATPILTNDLFGTGWELLSIVSTGPYSTQEGIGNILGWQLFEVNGSSYTLVTDDQNYSYEVKNSNKTYVARVYDEDDLGATVFSDYSNEIVVNSTIDAPVISRVFNSTLNKYNLLSYDDTHGFRIDLTADYSIHMDGNNRLVENYEWFEKNGSTLISIEDGSFGNEIIAYVPEGTSKTFVAKAYSLDYNNKKVYSDESNEITIDLSNPVYTFETVNSQNDNTKLTVRAFANNYEIAYNLIIINGSDYPNEGLGPDYEVSKDDFESEGDVEMISLELTDNKYVEATIAVGQ